MFMRTDEVEKPPSLKESSRQKALDFMASIMFCWTNSVVTELLSSNPRQERVASKVQNLLHCSLNADFWWSNGRRVCVISWTRVINKVLFVNISSSNVSSFHFHEERTDTRFTQSMHVWWNLGFGQNKRKGGRLGVGSVRRVWYNTFLNSPTFLQQRGQIKKVAKSKISNKTRLQVGEQVRFRDLYGPPQRAGSRVYSRNHLFTVWQVGSGQVQHQW